MAARDPLPTDTPHPPADSPLWSENRIDKKLLQVTVRGWRDEKDVLHLVDSVHVFAPFTFSEREKMAILMAAIGGVARKGVLEAGFEGLLEWEETPPAPDDD